MITLKQAVYTSVAIDGTIDYRLAGCSEGVASEDAEFLSWWGPGSDTLLDMDSDALSYNYFSLPSGSLCVARSTAGHKRAAGDAGQAVYTQFLIVAKKDFRHFGDNPFSLIRQALACGVLETTDRIRTRLPDLSIPECPVTVDQRLLARLSESIGPRNLAIVIHQALQNSRLIVASNEPPAAIVSGIFSCLPIGVRHDFSFTTGLKYSSRRPMRLVAIGNDETERLRVRESNRSALLDLTEIGSSHNELVDGWARWIQTALSTGRIGFLAREIHRQRETISSDELFALGLQLLEDVESLSLDSCDDSSVVEFAVDSSEESPSDDDSVEQFDNSSSVAEDFSSMDRPIGTADSLVGMEVESGEVSAIPQDESAANQSPEVVEMLERLDDMVYDAMAGSTEAAEDLAIWWPEVLDRLGEKLVSESREHYLDHAMKVWRRCISDQKTRDPARAAIVLDVLCTLFDEETVESICS